MPLLFGEYESWMKEQVIEMFCEEYGNEKKQFTSYYDLFYGTYQHNRSVRLVILDNQTVAGFVSFSYWPYLVNDRQFNSYQCGNVIIHKHYRGKGLYNQLLNYVNENAAKYKMDFIVGFPIKEILKLYLKSNWKNPFNLNWYVKVVNPAGKIFPVDESSLEKVLSADKKHTNGFRQGTVTLNIDANFYEWNKAYNNLARHFYFEYSEGENIVEFALKLNKRKYLNEIIVGEVNSNTSDTDFLRQALKKLRRRIFKTPGISIMSVCLNDNRRPNPILKALLQCGYKKINRDIKFIVNPLGSNIAEITDPGAWELYRRDIDTW